jgi:hypothetical protein
VSLLHPQARVIDAETGRTLDRARVDTIAAGLERVML